MTVLDLYKCLAAGQRLKIMHDMHCAYDTRNADDIPERYFDCMIEAITAEKNIIYIWL